MECSSTETFISASGFCHWNTRDKETKIKAIAEYRSLTLLFESLLLSPNFLNQSTVNSRSPYFISDYPCELNCLLNIHMSVTVAHVLAPCLCDHVAWSLTILPCPSLPSKK